MAVHGKVYDLTYFWPFHKGGPEEILSVIGTDATKAFDDNLHNEQYVAPLYGMIVGDYDDPYAKLYNFKSVACVQLGNGPWAEKIFNYLPDFSPDDPDKARGSGGEEI